MRWLLLPVALIYGALVAVRNCLFDAGIFMTRETALPSIVIGNISTGGTGKTPMTELLIHELARPRLRLAVLSRGYKRGTKGFLILPELPDARLHGDEPAQMKRKFPDIVVAVCENRNDGIQRLASFNPKPELVLLDDAFQHRWTKADVNIVLTSFENPFYNDWLLPVGSLRESRNRITAADIVVVTKCSDSIEPTEVEDIRRTIGQYGVRTVFFAGQRYGVPYEMRKKKPLDLGLVKGWVMLSGIASSNHLLSYLNTVAPVIRHFEYPDHHWFSDGEVEQAVVATDEEAGRLLVTTEKDAERLMQGSTSPENSIWVVPVKTEILFDQSEQFIQIINELLRKGKAER